MKTFIVNFKEIIDEEKNPGFKLGVKSILKNKKIKKMKINRGDGGEKNGV